ncbi:MAG: diaminopimelate decarboxylase, partial [Candidatus Kryptoniota bacterium]
PAGISLAGVGKSDRDIVFAIDRGIGAIIVESEQEIDIISEIATELHKTANILIRINPDVNARTHPHISTGLRENKFGIDIRVADGVIKKALLLPGINFVGLHTHIGSQITDIAPYAEAAESVSEFVRKLFMDGIRVKQIDFGGGLGVNYQKAITHSSLPMDNVSETSIDLLEFAAILKKNFYTSGCEVIIEPGRFIVADSGVLITKVLYKKKSPEKTFIVVDAGMNDMMRPALYGAFHQIVPISLQNDKTELVDIVGPVCESTDTFAVNREILHVERGDLLAIMTVGAYGYSLSSNYNSRPRPAEVLVEKDYSRIIRDRETFEDLI